MDSQKICKKYGLDSLVGADLTNADLSCINVCGYDLSGASLSGANLTGTNLEGANLAGTNLEGANLAGANLVDANLEGANLAGANLVDANLAGANLVGANLQGTVLELQLEEGLIKKIAEIVCNNPHQLDMSDWHYCRTIHCIAGWATTLSPKGKELEEKLGTSNTALVLLGAEAHSHFWDCNEDALEWLQTKL